MDKSRKQTNHMHFNTPIGNLEQKHGVKIGKNPDETIGDFLTRKGYDSLADMMRKD